MELLLKSYLLSVGTSIKQLRSREFGHNLMALHTQASEHGIDRLVGLDATDLSHMKLLNSEYDSKRLEYRESGTLYRIPDAGISRKVVQRLIRGIDYHLRQSGL